MIETMPATDSPAMENIRVNLRAMLEEGKFTIAGLARDAGVGRRTIYYVLDGQSDCTIPWAERIAKALGVTIYQLMDDR